METSGKNLTKATGQFIVPIIIWVAYYGFLPIKAGPFTRLWIESLLSAVAPYLFLWIISFRLRDKTKLCKVCSVAIFFVTVLVGTINYFQSHNAEEAIKAFLVPFSEVIVIWLLGVFTLIGMVVTLRKRNTIAISEIV